MRFRSSFLEPPLPDPPVAVLAAGGLPATPLNLALLRATLEALRIQQTEHRERPGVRRMTREMESFLRLGELYRKLGGPGAVPGAGGGFYEFCAACAPLLGISEIQSAEQFRKSLSLAIKLQR